MATFDAGTLEALFKLQDHVTPTLLQIQKTAKTVGKSLDQDLGVSTVKKLGEALTKSVGGAVMGGVVAGAAAIAGGLALATKSMLDLADQTSNLSASTGIGVESLQKLGFAGAAVGISMEEIAGGMQKFQRNLVEGSESSIKALNKLGLSRDALANMLPEQQLTTVLTALNDKIPNAANRTQIAVALLGKSGAALIPLGAGIGDVMKRAEELGLVMSQSDVAAADALGDSVGALGMTFGGLVNTIGSVITSNQSLHTLVAGLQDIVAGFTKGVKDNRAGLQDLVSGGVEFVTSALLLMVDAVELAGTAWDALTLVWKSALNVGGSLALMQLNLRLSAAKTEQGTGLGPFGAEKNAKADANVKALEQEIAMVQKWKDTNAEGVGKIIDGNEKWTSSVAKVRTSMELLQAKVLAAHGAQAKFSGSAKQGAASLEANAKAAEDAAKALEQSEKAMTALAEASDKAEQEAADWLEGITGPGAAQVQDQVEKIAKAIQKEGGISAFSAEQVAKLAEELNRLKALSPEGFTAAAEKFRGVVDGVVNSGLEEAALEAAEALDQEALAANDADEALAGCAERARFSSESFRELKDLAGALSDIFHEFGLNALASVVDGFLAGADAAEAYAKATTTAGKAAALAQGAMSAYKSGSVLGGAATGAMTGFAVGGPIGAGIGAIAGGLLGLFGKAKKAREEMEKMKASFIDSMGGMSALQQKAKEAGVSLDAMFKAKNAKQLEAAIGGIKDKLDTWSEAHEKLQAAVERYGFSLEELPEKMQQQKLDEMAGGLLEDYKLLTAAGFDQVTVLKRMGPAFQEYVNTALKAGAALPETMRPMIEQLIQSGQLLDENGVAFTSVEQAGLSFTESLTEGLSRMIESIDKLVAALTGVSNIRLPTIPGVPGGPGDAPGPPGKYENFEGGTQGWRNFGSGTPAMLHGIEAVIRPGDLGPMRGFGGPEGGGGTVINLSLNYSPSQTVNGAGNTTEIKRVVDEKFRNDADGIVARVREALAR